MLRIIGLRDALDEPQYFIIALTQIKKHSNESAILTIKAMDIVALTFFKRVPLLLIKYYYLD
tara:strand:- start:463 stop:648 length:186 start_codon:yes stop_codon:yes gene_type:complete